MASAMHMMAERYNEVEFDEEVVVESWLFMQSPVKITAVVVLYLLFVLKLGPLLMKDRRPFDLKNVLIIYNLFQVVFYVWLCSLLFRVDNALVILLKHCGSVSVSPHLRALLSYAGWWYFFSKVIELLDTVFFVLRKKQTQVTFLHVYHHSFMVLGTWMYLKYSRDEQGIMLAFLNSGVHIVMYFYYFLSALGPEYQKFLWWKKYMTWIQLSQFCMMLAYLVHITLMGCSLPKGLSFVLGINVAVFLYLFIDFYRKAYTKGHKQEMVNAEQLKKKN